ncbi:hypothetical protein IQ277_34560 [Nostocales cyanobacterium LEGE 12452]|nr:hypothetical protein [Nostocales cyanobacterium LEGE 12452]
MFSLGVACTSLRDAARSLLPPSGTAWFDSLLLSETLRERLRSGQAAQ